MPHRPRPTRIWLFTPGAPGRSKDVLTPENAGESFAVVPWLKGDYASYDPQYSIGFAGFQPGDSVYLSGGNGLPAGTYAILPARYALLDGAWLVTPASGYRDLPANTRIARHDGGDFVWIAVQGDRASDKRRIGTKYALPGSTVSSLAMMLASKLARLLSLDLSSF